MKFTGRVSLNEDFLSVFHPFYYMHTIFSVRKYNIYDNCVEVVKRKNIICALIINLLMLCFYGLVMAYTRFGSVFNLAYYFIYFEYAFNFGAVCFFNIYFSSHSVRLLLILYEVNKSLDSSKDLKKLKIFTWLSIIFMVSNCVALTFFKVAYDFNWSFMRGIFVSISVLLDMELLHITITVSILSYQTRMWNSIVENTYFGKVNDDEITVDNDTALEEMNNTLHSVNEAWSIIRSSSGLIVNYNFILYCSVMLMFQKTYFRYGKHLKSHLLQIIFHYVTTFIQSLFYAEIVIIWSKMHYVRIR